MMDKPAAMYLGVALLLCVAGARAGEPHNPVIGNVDPSSPAEGTILTISGSWFGEAPGQRAILLKRETEHRGGGDITITYPDIPIPILEWQPNRIVALLAGCAPANYQLAIREYPDVPMAVMRESRPVAVTVRSVPPARPLPAEAGKPQLTLAYPDLASPGDELNLYGDFPFPDATVYKILFTPGRRAALQNTPPFEVAPQEMNRNHARVMLRRRGLPPGDCFVSLVQNPVSKSIAKRIVVRATEPAPWEYTSHLPGSRNVACRVDAAVSRVGPGRRYADVLGLHFGSSQSHRYVSLNTQEELDQKSWNLRHATDSGSVIYPGHVASTVLSWSDRRIRVELQGDDRAFAYVGFSLYGIGDPIPANVETERCSNAVQMIRLA